jgi:GMP synthase-like glutamine amidotransferase
MGAWNSKPFGNDTALDWLWELEKADINFIKSTLRGFSKIEDSPDADESEVFLAAAMIVYASSQPIVKGIPAEAKKWVITHGYVPCSSDIALSINGARKILADSELQELWEESGNSKAWEKNTEKLISNLNLIDKKALPKRVPKPPGLPRVLSKMLEHPESKTNPKLIEKIWKKIHGLKDINAVSSETDYNSPLVLLSKYGWKDGVQYLLDKGIDINKSTPLVNNSLALSFACLNHHYEIAKLLLSAGAKVSSVYAKFSGEDKYHVVYDEGKLDRTIDIIRPSGALITVANSKSGSVEIVKLLVEYGADIHEKELNGYTLAHLCAKSGNIELLKWLLSHEVNIDERSTFFKETALFSGLANLEIVEVLLKAGANPNIPDRYKSTVLDKIEWFEEQTDDVKKIGRLLRRYGAKYSTELGYKRLTHVVSHNEFEDHFFVYRKLAFSGCHCTHNNTFNKEPFPNLDDFDFVVLLDANVEIDDDFFRLRKEEVAFVKQCIDNEKHIFAIGHSARLITKLLGGNIVTLDEPVMGWYEIQPNENHNEHDFSMDNPVNVFYWQKQSMTISAGVQVIAKDLSSNAALIQFGENTICAEFLPNLSDGEDYVEHFGMDIKKGKFIQSKAELTSSNRKRQDAMHKLLDAILDFFASKLEKRSRDSVPADEHSFADC